MSTLGSFTQKLSVIAKKLELKKEFNWTLTAAILILPIAIFDWWFIVWTAVAAVAAIALFTPFITERLHLGIAAGILVIAAILVNFPSLTVAIGLWIALYGGAQLADEHLGNDPAGEIGGLFYITLGSLLFAIGYNAGFFTKTASFLFVATLAVVAGQHMRLIVSDGELTALTKPIQTWREAKKESTATE